MVINNRFIETLSLAVKETVTNYSQKTIERCFRMPFAGNYFRISDKLMKNS